MKVISKISVENIENGYKVQLGNCCYYLLRVSCVNTADKLLIIFIDGSYMEIYLTFEDYSNIEIDFSIFSLEISRIKRSSCFPTKWLNNNLNNILSINSKKIIKNYLQYENIGV